MARLKRHPIEDARHRKAAKAQALAALADGSLSVSEAVQRPPDALSSVDLWDCLRACPGMGRSTVRIVCERSGVWPHVRLGELSGRERTAILLALPQRVKE